MTRTVGKRDDQLRMLVPRRLRLQWRFPDLVVSFQCSDLNGSARRPTNDGRCTPSLNRVRESYPQPSLLFDSIEALCLEKKIFCRGRKQAICGCQAIAALG